VPTYQYTCTECGEPVEVVQKFTDDPLTVCTACGGRLRKVFSPVGIVFKGSGFYRTDSRKGSLPADKPEKSEKSEKSDKATSDAGASASSSSNGSDSASNGKESKPAVKKAAETVAASSKSSSSSEKVA
jgi:putative FmdB family regulatory protein